MPHDPLPNYLRGARKSLGLTQKELAFLLGADTAGQVSRYERFVRTPNLQTALMLELVLDRPLADLFAGPRHEGRNTLISRARKLIKHLKDAPATRTNAIKLQALKRIAGGKEPKSNRP